MDWDPSLQITLMKDGRLRMFAVERSEVFEGQWLVVDTGARVRPVLVDQHDALPARQELDGVIRALLETGWLPA
jgi:hypothetical protein